MRAILFYSLFMVAFLAAGCQNDDNSSNNPGGSDDTSSTLTTGGDWRVSYFYDKDKEETHKFSGYTFRFQQSGALEVFLNGQLVHTGTWSVSTSSNKLIINTGQTGVLEELTDDWRIKSRTAQLIELQDDNTEHVEELHFTVLP